jgi:hypothetical protein
MYRCSIWEKVTVKCTELYRGVFGRRLELNVLNCTGGVFGRRILLNVLNFTVEGLGEVYC